MAHYREDVSDMLSKHTTFGKTVIVIGYGFGVFLLLAAILVTIIVGIAWSQGKTQSGMPLDTLGYIGGSVLVVVFWCYAALVLSISHLMRTFGSTRLCRILAGILCFFIPFGTVFSVLTFVHLSRQLKMQSQTAA